MASIRVRPDSGKLFLDFRFRGVRCRELTELPDSRENQAKLRRLLAIIEREIGAGTFDYRRHFPNSANVARFDDPKRGTATTRAAAIPAIGSPQPPTSPSSAPIPTTTFSVFSATWFAEAKVGWRESYQLTVRDILDFRTKLVAKPSHRKGKTLSAARVNTIMMILRQVLDEAADRFDFPSPYRRVKPLKLRKPDVYPFTLAEVEEILAKVRKDYRDYYLVRFLTGMRTGEIDGLKWKFVDFERRLILIRETIVYGKDEYTKTDASQRDIQMSQPVFEALQRQIAATGAFSAFVFCNSEGKPLEHNNVTKRVWYPLLRHLKLARRRPYQSRHTAATLWLASGENPEWIARQLGHANTQMLFTVYSRFVPNLTRRDGSAFERMVATTSTLGATTVSAAAPANDRPATDQPSAQSFMVTNLPDTLQPSIVALLNIDGALLLFEWTGAVMAIVGAFVMSMNRDGSRHAWLIWIASNLLLILPTAHAGHWGLMVMQVAFLIINVNGWWRYRRRQSAPAGRLPCSRPGTPRCQLQRVGGHRTDAATAEILLPAGSRRPQYRSLPFQPLTSTLTGSLPMANHKPSSTSITTTQAAREEDRRYYVYQLVDEHAPDVPLYIGKGSGGRLRAHAAAARAYNKVLATGAKPKAGRFVRKHAKILRAGRQCVAVKLEVGLSHREALEHEAALIASNGRLEEGGPLYNLSAGGDGVDPAITSSALHKKRAAKRIRRVNTDPAQVRARVNRLQALHKDPARHEAAIARLHAANQNPETRARTLAAASAGRPPPDAGRSGPSRTARRRLLRRSAPAPRQPHGARQARRGHAQGSRRAGLARQGDSSITCRPPTS